MKGIPITVAFSYIPCRAPNPDYSMSVSQRRAENIKRATLVFQDLAASKVPVDVVTLTTYMTGDQPVD